MLTMLKIRIRSRVAVATLGALLLLGGGTAFAMTAGQSPLRQLTSSLAAPTGSAAGQLASPAGGDNGQSADHLAVEGILTAYDAGHHTITVESPADGQGKATHTWTISVNGSTRVNGEHAKALTDLTKAIGHKVQVRADKQGDGSFLAAKVTVQGAEPDEHDHDDGQDNSDARD